MRALWVFFSFFKTFLQKGDFDNVFLFKKNSERFFFMKILLIFSSFFLILHFLISLAKKWRSGPKLLKGQKTSKTNFRGWNYLIYILARHYTLLNCWKPNDDKRSIPYMIMHCQSLSYTELLLISTLSSQPFINAEKITNNYLL